MVATWTNVVRYKDSGTCNGHAKVIVRYLDSGSVVRYKDSGT